MPGITDYSIHETPVSVIDFETTGTIPGRDRVCEITVIRCDPGAQPKVVLETLVNPARPIAATEIHGLTDEDVKLAPRFEDVAAELVGALEGSVVSAYNVYFDLKFLTYELEKVGVQFTPPHFCLMYMRPMLGIGKRCKLHEACQQHGIDLPQSHIATEDAFASARLLDLYMGVMKNKKIRTYGDLARVKYYKFVDSFCLAPLPGPSHFSLHGGRKLVARASVGKMTERQVAIREYWDTVATIVSDLNATDDEVAYAVEERKRLGLSKNQIRFLHARAFGLAISQFIDDHEIDDKEALRLRKLYKALTRMGWCPGN